MLTVGNMKRLPCSYVSQYRCSFWQLFYIACCSQLILITMLLFEQLEELEYKKAGNWYMHNNCSINLFTKEIKSTNRNVIFHYTFKNEIDIEKVEKIRMFIDLF